MYKQDLRVLKTIRQIDQSLLTCLQQTTFGRITVDMLCKEALINRSTFYRHYADKYALLNSFIDRTLADFRKSAKADFVLANTSDIHHPVYQSNCTDLLSHIYAQKDIYHTLANGSIGRDIWDEMAVILQENILRAIQSSVKISDKHEKYIRLYSRLFASNMMSVVLWWLEYDDELTLEDVKALMTANMKEGIFKMFKAYL